MNLAQRLDDAEQWIAEGIMKNPEQLRELPQRTRVDLYQVLLFIRITRLWLDGEAVYGPPKAMTPTFLGNG